MNGKIILITGGTGSLGKALVEKLFDKFIPKKVIVFSRDEFKQSEMRKTHEYDNLRYLIGNVRDKDRLELAMAGVDVVIHTAALKQVPTLEYNPMEAVKTNILGTQNVIQACLAQGVEKAIFISTDKAVNPINLYGATKLAAEKLWNAANSYAITKFSSVRYGNVIGSRGSVIPLFQSLEGDTAPVTVAGMTRFWITLSQAVDLVLYAYFQDETGVFVPELKSMRMDNLAKCFKDKIKIVGKRPGEKIHESLISDDEFVFMTDMKNHWPTDMGYDSDEAERFTQWEMKRLIGINSDAIGPNC
ncbi:MAG: SDR family NAD(P)-dependent oxidoreductase [Candidatus Peribacteraceae bacterium]|nr:SDR family NAD(P)-dependent oxidoreductase [Candidatus Peribacteraceae bacterium]